MQEAMAEIFAAYNSGHVIHAELKEFFNQHSVVQIQ